MKKALCLLLVFILALLSSCTQSRWDESAEAKSYTVYYAAENKSYADAVIEAIGGFGITATGALYDGTFGENAIVVGYVENEIIDGIVDGYSINAYSLCNAGGVFYIGGRKDFTDMSDAVEMFLYYFITDKDTLDLSEDRLFTLSPKTLDKATVCGVPLTEYEIVYGDNPGEAISYEEVAYNLANLLETKTGAKFVVKDEKSTPTEHEIIIGASYTRALSKKYRAYILDDCKFVWDISDGNIVIVGGTPNAIYFGAKDMCSYLEMQYGTAQDENKNRAKTVRLTKVACVGDSITQGDDDGMNYPTFLQSMLGYEYIVGNFGKSGYSTRTQDTYPYTKTAEYNAAVAFAADIVVYMLGTNDCQPTKTWTDNTKVEYKAAANMIFDALEEANPDVKIYVCLPSMLFANNVWSNWQKWGQQVKDYAVPLNRELAEERGYQIIDMYSWSLANSAVFKDGLHPSGVTYKTFAEPIYEALLIDLGE